MFTSPIQRLATTLGLALAFTLGASPAAAADNKAIRATLAALYPSAPIESIEAAPLPGYSVVTVHHQVIFISNDGRFILGGPVLDTVTRTNLTAEYKAAARGAALKTIAPEDKIVFSPANPKHTVIAFTDIDCAYCQMLHRHIGDYIAAGIRVEYVPWPRAGTDAPTFTQMQAVWCSNDRQQAFTDAILHHDTPDGAPTDCPVADDMPSLYRLGLQLGIRGTPTIFDREGHRLGGYLTAAELTQKLDK